MKSLVPQTSANLRNLAPPYFARPPALDLPLPFDSVREFAYHRYLDRKKSDIPGTATDDWRFAEELVLMNLYLIDNVDTPVRFPHTETFEIEYVEGKASHAPIENETNVWP